MGREAGVERLQKKLEIVRVVAAGIQQCTTSLEARGKLVWRSQRKISVAE